MKVSICIATFNGEKYIKDQLNSILDQIPDDSEVIISDNYSTDRTISIIKTINDKRVSIFFFDKKNVTLNFENALCKATGDFIFLADQDDVWLPGKFERVFNELAAYDLVITNGRIVNEYLVETGNYIFNEKTIGKGLLCNLITNSYVGCCIAFNRKVLDSSLPFPSNLPMHDWWIGLVAEITGSVKVVGEPMLLYRRHNNNASSTSGKSQFNFFIKVNMRLILIINLISRIPIFYKSKYVRRKD